MSQMTITSSDLFHKNGIGESTKADIYFILTTSVGVLSCAILLLISDMSSTYIALSACLFILTPPVAYIVRVLYIKREREFVVDVIGTYNDKKHGLSTTTALNYLGHADLYDGCRQNITADGSILVLRDHKLDYSSVRCACNNITDQSSIRSIVFVLSKNKITRGAKMLIDQNDIKVFSEHDMYDALYEKIKSKDYTLKQ